jgi:hypothetical protein
LEDLFERVFNLLANGADADAARHLKDDNSRLDLFLDKFHEY